MSENSFVSWLRQRFSTRDKSVICGCGADDCGIFITDSTSIAATTDSFVEGTHFTSTDRPEEIGWKAVTATISDLAASGCKPRWLLLSVALKKGLGEEWAKRLAESIARCAEKYSASIIGGDTTSSQHATMLTVTALGTPFPGGPVLRGGAVVGDVIAVTGSLGGSLSGRHLNPEPRFKEMQLLLSFTLKHKSLANIAEIHGLHASMDISDGLAIDLSRLCHESGIGAELLAEQIPVSQAARLMSSTSGKTPLQHALGDGEDFELLLAINPQIWPELAEFWSGEMKKDKKLAALSMVGRATSDMKLKLIRDDGQIDILLAEGYEHQW